MAVLTSKDLMGRGDDLAPQAVTVSAVRADLADRWQVPEAFKGAASVGVTFNGRAEVLEVVEGVATIPRELIGDQDLMRVLSELGFYAVGKAPKREPVKTKEGPYTLRHPDGDDITTKVKMRIDGTDYVVEVERGVALVADVKVADRLIKKGWIGDTVAHE